MIGEINADAGLNHLWLTGRLQVCVEHQVGSLVEAQGHAFGLDVWNGSGLPKQKMAVRIEGLRLDSDFHAAKAGAGLSFALTGCVSAVDQDVGVVHVLLVS